MSPDDGCKTPGMARLGVFCLPMHSHMNLFLALGRALANRGHNVTFFGISDNEPRVRDEGLDFVLMEPPNVPIGTLGLMMRRMSKLGNFACMRLQGQFDTLRYRGILDRGPELIREARLDAMIVDQAEACSGSLAEMAGLPWVSVCNGLCLNSEAGVPPFLTPWNYSDTALAVTRNRLAYAALEILTRPTQTLINQRRQEWHLKPVERLDDTFSPFAQIAQQNREFDFPRRELPSCFHYVGPIRSLARGSCEFPWDRLDGRPLIYASLGTVLNGRPRLYEVIARACAGIEAQLVLSLGGSNLDERSKLPGAPVVVRFAPQRELLGRAALTITHAGLNTTLESLGEGVPLVAIPISFEQPAIAARIRWTGTGEMVRASDLTAERLGRVIRKVFNGGCYRTAAEQMGQAIRWTRGCEHAADIIEQVLRTRKPVLAGADS